MLAAKPADPLADQHMAADYLKSYGQPTKPRHQDPSMFELMQWREAEKDHLFKNNKESLRSMDEYRRYRALIDKSNDGFTTESQDNFRKFAFKKLEDVNPHIPFESTVRASHDKAIPRPAQHVPVVSANPDYRSEYVDEMTNKLNQDTYDRVKRTLEFNDIERREKSASRERRPYSGQFKRSDLLDWPEGAELQRIRQEEEEERQAEQEALREQLAAIKAAQQEEVTPSHRERQTPRLLQSAEPPAQLQSRQEARARPGRRRGPHPAPRRAH